MLFKKFVYCVLDILFKVEGKREVSCFEGVFSLMEEVDIKIYKIGV